MSTSARFCPQCGTPAASYATICSNCGRSLSEASSVPPTQYASPSSGVPPTQYASPSSGIPPTQYASPPSTDPYSSSAYSASAPTTDPYGSSAYGVSSTPITNPYSSSPYEVSSAAPPPPASVTFTGTQKKGRRGLWIGLGAVAVLVIGGVVGFLILGAANASTPTKTLQVFCTAVKGRDTPTAYAQLSNAAKSQLSETRLAQNINAFNDCTVNNVNDAANTGTLTYTLAGNLKINQEVTLVNEGGTWKINSQQLQSTPTLTLATYCEAVKKGDFQTAYNQFSQNYQSGQSEADFAKSFSQPIADCVPSNVNDSAGTGTVTYTYSGASSGTQIADETLVNQNGTWKIDSEKIRQ
jgi:hypothetical protein